VNRKTTKGKRLVIETVYLEDGKELRYQTSRPSPRHAELRLNHPACTTTGYLTDVGGMTVMHVESEESNGRWKQIMENRERSEATRKMHLAATEVVLRNAFASGITWEISAAIAERRFAKFRSGNSPEDATVPLDFLERCMVALERAGVRKI